jgi:hypothetical protein
MGKLAGRCAEVVSDSASEILPIYAGLKPWRSDSDRAPQLQDTERNFMQLTFHAPQLVFVVLLFLGLIVAIVKHGEKRSDYSAFVTFFDTMITLALLYWGGFFK